MKYSIDDLVRHITELGDSICPCQRCTEIARRLRLFDAAVEVAEALSREGGVWPVKILNAVEVYRKTKEEAR